MTPALYHDRIDVVTNPSCRYQRCGVQTMMSRSHPSARRVRTAILRSVSRSFYLSIRFLPAQLREPIALAYLLARTTDSVADTSEIPGTVRTETLKMLSDGIQGKASREVVIDLVTSFVLLQKNAAE
jgi:farnesyl-diphosphate farnesyltransferase